MPSIIKRFAVVPAVLLAVAFAGLAEAAKRPVNPPATAANVQKCKSGQIWNKKQKKCVQMDSGSLDSDDLYWQARVLAAVEERGLLPRMLFSCFDDPVLERLRTANSRARLAVLVSARKPRHVLERAARVAAEAINPHVSLVDRPFVEAAHAAGLRVYPYTANERAEMARLADCGVDGIITNYPDRLASLLDGG